MQLKLNKFTASLLLAVLSPLVFVIKMFQNLSGGKKAKAVEHQNTIEGDPLAYTGDRPLVVALWMNGASLWKVATEPALERLKLEFTGRCEFAYIECKDSGTMDRFKADILPLVILYNRGTEIARYPNLMSEDQLKTVLERMMKDGLSGSALNPVDSHQ
jgi:thioredoxin-like negative regulator of GroEL